MPAGAPLSSPAALLQQLQGGSSSDGLTLQVQGGRRGGGAWLRLRRRHRAFANPRAVLQRQPAATPTQSDEEALEVFPQPG